ncbi:hypothetical protein Tco_0401840 [Tanacetum coccineum]
MPTSIHSDFDESQMTYGKNSNDQSETDSNDFVSCASSDKSSEPKTNDFASCDSSDKSSLPRYIWVREDGELLLSPQQVVLGETVDHIYKGDPRTMVDLNNLHGLTLIDPLGRLKSEMAWVSQCN